jgi:lysophospholipase
MPAASPKTEDDDDAEAPAGAVGDVGEAPSPGTVVRGPVGDGQLVATEDNPVPDGSISGYFDGLDLARIRYARWEADKEAVHLTGGPGTVCLFTGRAEFIEKYFETVGDLRRRGFDVAIMDWRGQGRSARPLGNPRKGHITTFDQHHGDLVHFMREVVLPDCRPPYFALAHSMGGAILLQAAARRQPWFQRMVLSAPMLHLARRRPSAGTIRRIAEIACYMGLDGLYVPGGGPISLEALPFSGNLLTSDPARFARSARILKAADRSGIPAKCLDTGADGGRRQGFAGLGQDDRAARPPAPRRRLGDGRRRPPRAADGARPLPRAVLGRLRRLRARKRGLRGIGAGEGASLSGMATPPAPPSPRRAARPLPPQRCVRHGAPARPTSR